MKSKWSYYLTSIFLFGTLLVTYQNCGDLGGSSPFDILDEEEVDLNSEAAFSLNFTQNPQVNNNYLSMTGNCKVEGYYVSHNRITWTVYNQAGQTVQSSYVNCVNSSFSINQYVGHWYNNSLDYRVDVQIFGIDETFQYVEGPMVTANILAPTTQYPPSLNASNNNHFDTLYESNKTYREISVLNNINPYYNPYTGLVIKIEFTMGEDIPVSDGSGSKLVSLMEVLPYSNLENKVQVLFQKRPDYNNQIDPHTIYHYTNGTYSPPKDVYFTIQDSDHHILKKGHRYIYGVSFNRQGFYNYFLKTSSGTTIDFGQIGFAVSDFGGAAIKVRLGATYETTPVIHFPHMSDINLSYRVCGYLNNTAQVDTSCINGSL